LPGPSASACILQADSTLPSWVFLYWPCHCRLYCFVERGEEGWDTSRKGPKSVKAHTYIYTCIDAWKHGCMHICIYMLPISCLQYCLLPFGLLAVLVSCACAGCACLLCLMHLSRLLACLLASLLACLIDRVLACLFAVLD